MFLKRDKIGVVKLNGKSRQISSSKFLGDRKKVTVRHTLPLEMCSRLQRDKVPTVFSGDIYNIFIKI